MAAACMALQCERSDGGRPGRAGGGGGGADWAALAAYICWMRAVWRSAVEAAEVGGEAFGGAESAGGGAGGLVAAADISIMARAFSAAAAATIRLLFSASVAAKRGLRKRRAGSMNPGGGPIPNPGPGGIP